jgi:hypothetical protein
MENLVLEMTRTGSPLVNIIAVVFIIFFNCICLPTDKKKLSAFPIVCYPISNRTMHRP